MRLIVFDLDGTLYRSLPWVWRTVSAQARKIPELHVIDSKKKLLDIYKGNFYEKVCDLAGLPRSKAPSLARRMLKVFPKEYNPKLMPGVKPALKSLSGKCSMVVLSSNFKRPMERLLRKDGILKLFSEVSGADSGKSKTRRILDLVKKLKLRKADVVYVTDTSGDVLEMRKAGIASVGVSWGFHNASALRKAGAKKVLAKPSAIVGLVG